MPVRMRITIICLVTIALAGCQAGNRRELPQAKSPDIIGAWQTDVTGRGDGRVIFHSDGTYCAYKSRGSLPWYSVGRWGIDAGGNIAIEMSKSNDPANITPTNLSLILEAVATSRTTIKIGSICPHCPDGIAGVKYRRADEDNVSCSAP